MIKELLDMDALRNFFIKLRRPLYCSPIHAISDVKIYMRVITFEFSVADFIDSRSKWVSRINAEGLTEEELEDNIKEHIDSIMGHEFHKVIIRHDDPYFFGGEVSVGIDSESICRDNYEGNNFFGKSGIDMLALESSILSSIEEHIEECWGLHYSEFLEKKLAKMIA